MISSRKARRLMAQGWNAADLHVHTRFSYDVIADTSVDPRFLYQKGRDAGMSFVTFTDHDTMAA
jgi:predicted metal-dependent phosphoesterase TrpH